MTAAEYSNIAAQMLRDGVQETLGLENVSGLAASRASGGQAFFQEVQVLLGDLEQKYDTPCSRGLAMRIGRAMFRSGLKQLGEQAGFRSIEYRMLPSPQRVERGLQSLARMIGEALGGPVTVTDEKTYWSWEMQRCPICDHHHTDEPFCYLLVGLIQEFACWAGGGRYYRVVESACRAAGAPACVFRIDKTPLD